MSYGPYEWLHSHLTFWNYPYNILSMSGHSSTLFFYFFLFFVVLEFELRALHLLGKHYTILDIFPALHFFLGYNRGEIWRELPANCVFIYLTILSISCKWRHVIFLLWLVFVFIIHPLCSTFQSSIPLFCLSVYIRLYKPMNFIMTFPHLLIMMTFTYSITLF
jgi:hypothetical protein